MQTRLNLFFLWCALVGGVILPGRCPSAPPTQPLIGEDNILILNGVPFAHHSHLFQAHNISNTANLELTVGNSIHLYFDKDSKRGIVGRFEGIPTSYPSNNDSLKFNSTVVTIDRNTREIKRCHDLLTEDIRVWADGHFIFIWSCEDVVGNKEHDEAVLILIIQLKDDILHTIYVDENPEVFARMMSTFNESARKYLSDSLLDKIYWSPDMPKVTPMGYNTLFMCKEKQDNRWLLLGGFLLFLGVLALGLWLDLDKCPKRPSNRVVPCEG